MMNIFLILENLNCKPYSMTRKKRSDVGRLIKNSELREMFEIFNKRFDDFYTETQEDILHIFGKYQETSDFME